MYKLPASSLAHTLHQADQHFQAGRLAPAAKLLTQILKLLPRHAQAHARLGQILLQNNQIDAALTHLRQAVQAQPKHLPYWLRLINALRQSGKLDELHDVIEQAARFGLPEAVVERLIEIAIAPHRQLPHGLLALYQSCNDHQTTANAARLFIEDYPEHPLGWQILGAVLHDSGKLDEALEIKQATVEKFPKDANAHNNLAHTLLALQRYAPALASARAALKLNPALAQARTHEAQALMGLEKDTA